MIQAITVLSQADAEQYFPQIGEYIISITAPGAPLAKLRSGWTDTLRLQFGDVAHSPQTIKAYCESGQDVQVEFRTGHARAIRQFLKHIEADPISRTIVLHCHAGQSRSAAVATWIAKRNGIAVPASWSGRDWSVFEVLETLERYE